MSRWVSWRGSIQGILMMYMLYKSLEIDNKLELYSPGGICYICWDKQEELQHCSCNSALRCGGYCEECQLDLEAVQKCRCKKVTVSRLLRTGMVGGPLQVFMRYHEKDTTCIRSHVYGEKSKLTKKIIGYDTNSLYIYSWCDVMPCDKDVLVVNEKLFAQKQIAKFFEGIWQRKEFGFAQVDIEIPNKLYDKFSEMAPLCVVQEDTWL